MKKNPFFTVMIIPHTEDGPRSLRLSTFFVRLVSVMVIAALTFSFYWVYNYTLVKGQNDYLLETKNENQIVINEYSKDYLLLFQNLKKIQDQMVAVEMLEEQVKQKSGFDPTKSYFSSVNQDALTEGKQDKNNVTVSTLSTAASSQVDEGQENAEGAAETADGQARVLNVLLRLMEERNQVVSAVPSMYPTSGIITTSFGFTGKIISNNRFSFSEGVDIVNSYGTPIYATADGIVIYSGDEGDESYRIVLSHGNGYETYYGHNSRNVVELGDFVEKGQVIAYMGNNSESIGPHLNYRVRSNGQYINPINFFN